MLQNGPPLKVPWDQTAHLASISAVTVHHWRRDSLISLLPDVHSTWVMRTQALIHTNCMCTGVDDQRVLTHVCTHTPVENVSKTVKSNAMLAVLTDPLTGLWLPFQSCFTLSNSREIYWRSPTERFSAPWPLWSYRYSVCCLLLAPHSHPSLSC